MSLYFREQDHIDDRRAMKSSRAREREKGRRSFMKNLFIDLFKSSDEEEKQLREFGVFLVLFVFHSSTSILFAIIDFFLQLEFSLVFIEFVRLIL